MSLIDHFLGRAIRRGELTVTDAGKPPRTFGAPDPDLPSVAIALKPGAAARIIRDPGLGAAETYMDGSLVIERGDLLQLLTLIYANTPWEKSSPLLLPGPMARFFYGIRHRFERYNMERQSRRNVAHHYDLSDRLYDLFLDVDRQYTCAYFTDPANSLEQAQADKKAHILAKLRVEAGMKCVEFGCGWGGMALYIHQMTGAEVLGVTLSVEQVTVARRRAAEAGVADKVKFELLDYRKVEGKFDRVYSVGILEHIGPAFYRTFFAKTRELSTDDGVMFHHTIGRAGAPGVTDKFTAKYIFPGGYIPSLSELARGWEGMRFWCTDIEVLRLHYAYTLKAWYDRTTAARDEIVRIYDERFFRMWQYYLAGSYVAFLHGSMVNYQLQFARSRDALPITRDYMMEEERRLAEARPRT